MAASWHILEGSQEAGGVNARYIFKTSILLMPALVILQGIAESLKAVMTLMGYQDAVKQLDEHDEEHAL